MKCTRKITENIFWIGGNDRRLALFENIFPIKRGVSYNSYFIRDDKTAVIDTVDAAISKLFFENIEYLLNGRSLDYLIVNHMEPDHSANIEEIVRRYPDVTIVCSVMAEKMMGNFFNETIVKKCMLVKEGDKISLGTHELNFVMAPMVHWPECMVSYESSEKVLFSADAFGTFGAINGNVFDDEVELDSEVMRDARRYYTNIVGKYGQQVQALLKKSAALDIKMIAPLHGLVWRKNLDILLEKYDKWSKYEPEEKAVMIVYASMYGNTENAADILAVKLAEEGVKNIVVYDVSNTDLSELIAETFRCSHLVLACPTYNSGIYPLMEHYILDMKALNVQNRIVGLIENGSWAPTAGNQMKKIIEEMKNMTVLDHILRLDSTLAESKEDDMESLKEAICKSLL